MKVPVNKIRKWKTICVFLAVKSFEEKKNVIKKKISATENKTLHTILKKFVTPHHP